MPHHAHQSDVAPATLGRTIRSWARFYDVVAWAMSFGQEPAIRRQTIAVANLAPGEKVLDVGCGTGTLAIAAARRVGPEGEVHGTDASPEMIAVASSKAASKHVPDRFRVAAIENLPFADDSFDVVLSSFMLHHLPDDVKAQGFAEIKRVLKPGGRFLAVDLSGSRSVLGHIMSALGHSMKEGYVDGLKAMFSDAGLEQVEEITTKFNYLAFLKAKA
jgi:demethylmenaquinone methyltransferase/2-methoxy-6-polyprenyl-1,4-benzoquinol methylase/phosphoethanolamine N-methyltransferase